MELKICDKFDLADGSLQWVCIKGVLNLHWRVQFFSFALADFGLFLGVSPVTEIKLNVKGAFVKVRCS